MVLNRDLTMRKNIEKLTQSGITAYRVSKDTEIAISVVQKIFDGTSNLDNISLKNAETLSAYYVQQLGNGEQGHED